MIINDPYREVACGFCGTLCIGGRVYAISSDDSVRYCSESCITNDYIIHQYEIGCLAKYSRISMASGDAPSRLMFRIASIRKMELNTSSALHSNTPSFDTVMKLESVKHHIDKDSMNQVT